jgi:hypothetical protein
VTEENIQKIKQTLTDLTVPQNFVQSAPTYNPNNKDTFNLEILRMFLEKKGERAAERGDKGEKGTRRYNTNHD